MRKSIKFGITCLLAIMSISAVGITFASGQPHLVEAAQCSHQGNHYACIEATTKNSGIKEYWVCCKCHQHFLAYTDGVWSEGGQAKNITDKNDDRYIPKTSEYNEDGFKLSGDGTTVVDYNGSDKDVVIPEGVTTIGSGAFSGSNITSITLPSTLKEIGDDAFKNTDSLTSIVIPGSVEEISANAFLDNPNGLSYLFGSGRDITIYLEITKAEADAKFEKGWDNAGAQYLLGRKVGKTKAIVYYKGQWHYDANGNPTPGK